MKLVIDSKIPYIKGFAELLGETVYLPGAEISAADVRDADVLIIRTRTRCDEALRIVQDKLDSKNFYAFNPAFDKCKC